MLEIPETLTLASQLNLTIQNRTIKTVLVNASPHKFAFFYKDPNTYPDLLIGKKIGIAKGIGGLVEIKADDLCLTFGDGTNLRYYPKIDEVPPKHQFLLGFDDGSALVGSIQMYGFISVFIEGENQNPYYLIAKTKPSPLSDDFTDDYFMNLVYDASDKLSVKALLATEQRIPGLGNGVLQDILFRARISPKRKLSTLSDEDVKALYQCVKQVLKEMTDKGGRDTEKDLYGHEGGYRTIMSAKHSGEPCPICAGPIVKEAYMGGSVYTCPNCQPKEKA
jgi:formamidopyrimidine-DNA glycosylase